LLDEHGPERGAPLRKYLFWIDPAGVHADGAHAGSLAALPHARCRSPEKSPFSRPDHRFPGGRIAQLGETEGPSAAGQRCGLGLHGQMATPMRGTTATTADDFGRIRVLTIAITAPQQAQSIDGRSLRADMKRFGSNVSKRCCRR
jgi:hypothetical protein